MATPVVIQQVPQNVPLIFVAGDDLVRRITFPGRVITGYVFHAQILNQDGTVAKEITVNVIQETPDGAVDIVLTDVETLALLGSTNRRWVFWWTDAAALDRTLYTGQLTVNKR